VKEDFLQFVWKQKLFRQDKLFTTDGKPVKIITTGQQNFDSGPDFFNARIQIGDTVWAGNIEIHQKSSHWYLHRHESDAAFENVILHVVELDDVPVRIKNHDLPTLEITWPDDIRDNFEQLLSSEKWIACEEKFASHDPILLRFWFSPLMIERLESKTSEMLGLLAWNKNSWNETFYQLLARNFGMKTNALPFELLAKSLPLQILTKHKNDVFQLEALLFGQAGLLSESIPGDNYYSALCTEYKYLAKKYNLAGIETHLWKYLRLRPVNFPGIRIAQLAKLINQSTSLFSRIIETENLSELQQLFQVNASEYWDNHYHFNTISAENKSKVLGLAAINNLIINAIVPLMFVYGDQHLDQKLKDKALQFLEQLPLESNHIIGKFKELGVDSRNAFETQALIQLKNKYCIPKKCLNCQLGAKFISSCHK
jgi:hypothetical protein